MVFIGIKPSYVNNRRDFDFCISPSRIVLPPGQLLSARGPGEMNRLSWSGTDEESSVLLHVFSVGVFSGENMQTPHRKAREIAHLSTEGLGRTCPPEPTAPHAGIKPMTFLL